MKKIYEYKKLHRFSLIYFVISLCVCSKTNMNRIAQSFFFFKEEKEFLFHLIRQNGSERERRKRATIMKFIPHWLRRMATWYYIFFLSSIIFMCICVEHLGQRKILPVWKQRKMNSKLFTNWFSKHFII